MESYIGKICPFCNAEIQETDTVKVCPECEIPHHEACWAENHGCTTFGCAQQHQEAPAPEAAPAPVVAPVAAPVVAATPVAAPAPAAAPTEICTNCGTPLTASQAFCPQCGTPKAAPKRNVCSKCGAELQEGQAFCAVCGQRAGLAIAPEVNSAINQFNANVQQQQRKKNVKLPIILGAIAAVILALILLLKGPSVEEIVLSKSSIELKVGESQSVSYTISPAKASDVKVTWKSSNESVATVNSNGKITAKSDGSCTITVTAGGKSDSLTVTVKTGPDLKEIYNKYCKSIWAEYGADGSYLSVDTNPYDWDDDGLAYPDAYYAIKNINNALGLPDSLINDMGETTSLDGKQTEVFGDITVSWKYHPDRGLEVTYKVK